MRIKCNILFLILTSALLVHGQKNKSNSKKDVSLSFSTYNHASQIYQGITHYIISKNTLKIRRTYIFSKKKTLLLSRKLESRDLEFLQKICLDTLEKRYTNYCIMTTSGSEYFVWIKTGATEIDISLHHYYITQIEMLVNELNKFIPDDLKINYVTKEIEQNCSPW